MSDSLRLNPALRQQQMFAEFQGGEELKLHSVEDVYQTIANGNTISFQAKHLLQTRSWLTKLCKFDPWTGDASPIELSKALTRIKYQNDIQESVECRIEDRVYRICEHVDEALIGIFDNLRGKILRKHVLMPIHSARELDSVSLQWLNRRPGRTFREKLAGRPTIKAVQRRESHDTTENQLLKAFVVRLGQILSSRRLAIDMASETWIEELRLRLQQWLNEDGADISSWRNLPPNNVLLQDKHYRKIWDAWLWLLKLDGDIEKDYERLNSDHLLAVYWSIISRLYETHQFRFFQQPIFFDYDNFEMNASLPIDGYYVFSPQAGIEIGTIENILEGYGFIKATDRGSLFFHKSDLSGNANFGTLEQGDLVSYRVEKNNRGPCAINVNAIRGSERMQFTFNGRSIELATNGNSIHIEKQNGKIELSCKHPSYTELYTDDISSIPSITSKVRALVANEFQDKRILIGELNHNIHESVECDYAVIDLYSLRPVYTTDLGEQYELPFRLVQQYWPTSECDNEIIDCGSANAICFNADVTTVSMQSIFYSKGAGSQLKGGSAVNDFIGRVRQHINSRSLTYLLPDAINDFSLESIRKSANYYYENTYPLPKCIAAIFGWQSSEYFGKDRNILSGDIVIVIDKLDSEISYTPLVASYTKDVERILPQSKGIVWERHPTIISKHNNLIIKQMIENLKRNGCSFSEELLTVFGFKGLLNEAGRTSFIGEDGLWYHLPGDIRTVLFNRLKQTEIQYDLIDQAISFINTDKTSNTTYLMSLDSTIKKPELRRNYSWQPYYRSLVLGGRNLLSWQKQCGDGVPLWKDHLPELSMEVIGEQWYCNFELVKDSTVIPRRGQEVRIEIGEEFTLPARKKYYSFPLSQGAGYGKLEYEAYLKSPAFPLKKATKCKLIMTYTYGDDDPYELRFYPIDKKAGFKSVSVVWRPLSVKELDYPKYPRAKTWVDFLRYPQLNKPEPRNLYKWVQDSIKKLIEYQSYEIGEIVRARKCGKFSWGKRDRKGDYFCQVDFEGKEVFCHSSQFIESVEVSCLDKNSDVYFDLNNQDPDWPKGNNVTFSSISPPSLNKAYQSKLREKRGDLEKTLSSLRFPVLTIWDRGRTLSDAPPELGEFTELVYSGSQVAMRLYESKDTPYKIKEELFLFMCNLHQDAPDGIGDKLEAYMNDIENNERNLSCRKYSINIAYAIGKAELDWQKRLFQRAVTQTKDGIEIKSIKMTILAVALWRCDNLLGQLSLNEIYNVVHGLLRCMNYDLFKISQNPRNYQQGIVPLCRHLELLLVLIRTRAIEKEDPRNKVLSPEKSIVDEYIKMIDKIADMLPCLNLELRPRIKLQLEANNKFDLLLFALRMYLTGDDGANQILITGITDGEMTVE